MTSQQWRLLFGAINAGCAFLLVQPQVQAVPLVAIILGTIVAVLGYVRAPENAE